MSAIRIPETWVTLVDAPTGVAATDTANVQAAIDSIDPAVGGIVQLRAGEYLCDQITMGAGVSLRGVGTMFDYDTLDLDPTTNTTELGTVLQSNLTGGQDLLTFAPAVDHFGGTTIEGLHLRGTGTDGNGLVLNRLLSSKLDRVFVSRFGGSGIVADGGLIYTFTDCSTHRNGLDGLTLRKTSGYIANLVRFSGCQFFANGRDGIRCGDGAGPSEGPSNSQSLEFHGSNIEANGEAGIRLMATSGVCAVHLYNAWFEYNAAAAIRASSNSENATRIHLLNVRWPISTDVRFNLGTGCFVTDPGVVNGCSLGRPSQFLVSNNSFTFVDFTSELYSTDSALHSNTVEPSKVVVPSHMAGVWDLSYTLQFAPNATGVRYASVYKNDAVEIGGISDVNAPSGSMATMMTANLRVELEAGDFVKVIAFQTSGGQLGIQQAANVTPLFQATFLGPKAI